MIAFEELATVELLSENVVPERDAPPSTVALRVRPLSMLNRINKTSKERIGNTFGLLVWMNSGFFIKAKEKATERGVFHRRT